MDTTIKEKIIAELDHIPEERMNQVLSLIQLFRMKTRQQMEHQMDTSKTPSFSASTLKYHQGVLLYTGSVDTAASFSLIDKDRSIRDRAVWVESNYENPI